MTPNIQVWMDYTTTLTDWFPSSDMAYDTARRIAERPTDLTIQRAGAANFTQSVRLEPLLSTTETAGDIVNISRQRVLVTGYKDHPVIADTLIRRGDRFFYEGTRYDVLHILTTVPGRFLAIAEAVQ